MKTQYSATDRSGRYNNILAQIYLKEAYDIEYALYDHDDPSLAHPFQFHLMTEKKMTKKFGLFREYLKRYHIHQIQKYFGINFLEFMAMPIDKVEDMLEVSNILAEEETRSLREVEDKMKRQVNRMESTIDQGQSPNTNMGIGYGGY